MDGLKREQQIAGERVGADLRRGPFARHQGSLTVEVTGDHVPEFVRDGGTLPHGVRGGGNRDHDAPGGSVDHRQAMFSLRDVDAENIDSGSRVHELDQVFDRCLAESMLGAEAVGEFLCPTLVAVQIRPPGCLGW
jgi:hypothetical protein